MSVAFPEIAGPRFDPDVADQVEELPVEPELEQAGDLVEWTPERAASVARAFGLALHTFDPAARLDGGDELWRATEREAREIGEPLARILARYEPARRLAGVVDEAELGVAFVSYAKRNMAYRGRLIGAEKERRRDGFGDGGE